MLFLIREPILRGPRDLSVLKTVLMDPETEGPCLDYHNCEYCNRTDVHLEMRMMLSGERESDLSFTDNDDSEGDQPQEYGHFSDEDVDDVEDGDGEDDQNIEEQEEEEDAGDNE